MNYWGPAGVGFLCQGLGMALVGIYGFFVLPLAEEFSVGAAVINTGPALLLVIPALVGPLVGGLVDRISIRALLSVGVLIAMGGIYGVSLAPNLLTAALCFMVFALGLAGYGPLTINALMIKIYRTRVGRALAIAAMGVSAGSILLPLCTAWLMELRGWREALQIISIGICLILIPTIITGLPAHVDPGEAAGPEAREEVGSLRQYFRERPFWLIGLVIALIFNVSLIMAICYPPHFSQLGFTGQDAALFMAAGGVAGMTGKVLVALQVDRWKVYARLITAGLLCLQLAGFALLVLTEQFHTVIIATSLIGFSSGALIPMHPFLNNNYFPPDYIGRISGAQAPMLLPFGLIGAPLSGYVFDVTGSFLPVFITISVVLGVGMGLLFLLPPTPGAHSAPVPNR